MPTLNDGRFWSSKRMIQWKNVSEEVCPAYSPITFSWDNDGHSKSPWVVDETVLDGGSLALPAAFGCMAETGYADALYAINGPFDVQPGCYGRCSIVYPLPILFDPQSFPIPVDEPGAPPEPGTWDEYTTAYPGDIEGPPLLGFVSEQ